MNGGGDPLSVGRPQASDPIHPGVGGRIAEPALDTGRSVVTPGAEAAVEIQGVEERDADAGLGSGGEQRLTHGVRIAIRRAIQLVVEVVELADTGDPGQCHFGERGPGKAVIAVRFEPLRSAIHQITPRPEAAAVSLGARTQCPVEGVAVRVRETWNGEAHESGGVARRRVDTASRLNRSGRR